RDRVRADAVLRGGVRADGPLRVRARPASDLRHLALRLRCPQLAARAAPLGVRAARLAARRHRALRRGLRRGPLDAGRGDQDERAGSGARRLALRPLRVARRDQVLGQGRRGAAQPVRRPRDSRGREGEGQPGPALMALAEDQRLANPLLERLQLTRRPEPCAMVLFGASGDLTKRNVLPALYSLAYRPL